MSAINERSRPSWVTISLLLAMYFCGEWPTSVHGGALVDVIDSDHDLNVLELLGLELGSSSVTNTTSTDTDPETPSSPSSNKTSKILNGPNSSNPNKQQNQNYYGPNNLIRPPPGSAGMGMDIGGRPGAPGGDLTVQGSGQPPSVQNHPHISDIDMQLLGAMEKLVVKMEKLEGRVKTVESIVHYLTNNNKEKPIQQGNCPEQFSKVDGIKGKCFRVSSLAKSGVSDWKSAAGECGRLGGRLVEMLTYSDFHRLVSFLQKHVITRITGSSSAATDFWTGGLNPGLIWLWSESGQQIDLDKRFWNENDNSSSAPGCLKLSYSARLGTYFFKSAPCQQGQNFICEILDNTVARALAHFEETVLSEMESN